ncbi:hypothetical protein K458DRAFT_391190 [Lentithecium fluviatile CBS 122367]|uniref:Uncharacterized protein n=1 Tax=Lentithecium fluviatile CBS 122367 TaxID=1168545 RepID=A0A6G1IVL6_9PLEO|nr:hypothetical protein K458DRAFT_391190 [Lentithecium fluviatile CBS 122367]
MSVPPSPDSYSLAALQAYDQKNSPEAFKAVSDSDAYTLAKHRLQNLDGEQSEAQVRYVGYWHAPASGLGLWAINVRRPIQEDVSEDDSGDGAIRTEDPDANTTRGKITASSDQANPTIASAAHSMGLAVIKMQIDDQSNRNGSHDQVNAHGDTEIVLAWYLGKDGNRLHEIDIRDLRQCCQIRHLEPFRTISGIDGQRGGRGLL